MPEIKTEVGTRLKTLSRLKTLYYFVYEMAQSFGVGDSALDSIKKGILDRRIIKTIKIDYYNDIKENPVGRIVIDIDWEKHTLLASTDYGSKFILDSTKSIRSQITDLSDIIIEHVDNMRNALGITRIKTRYQYIDEILDDEEAHEEARRFMGHVEAEKIEISEEAEFNNTLEVVFEKMEEVMMSLGHN